jgi:hypothetical protein
VHWRDQPGGDVVVLNTATGEWYALNSTAGELWRAWQAGEHVEYGVSIVAGRYPETARSQIRADALTLLDQLRARGLLVPWRAEKGPTAACAGTGRQYATVASGGVSTQSSILPATVWNALALCFLLAAAVGARLPFRVMCALLRGLRRYWCRGGADAEQARRVVAAVTRAARWYPGRAACLEQTLAAALMAAVLRRRLDCCLGVATDPYRFHAWVELDGRPVPGPQDQGRDQYRRVLSF